MKHHIVLLFSLAVFAAAQPSQAARLGGTMLDGHKISNGLYRPVKDFFVLVLNGKEEIEGTTAEDHSPCRIFNGDSGDVFKVTESPENSQCGGTYKVLVEFQTMNINDGMKFCQTVISVPKSDSCSPSCSEYLTYDTQDPNDSYPDPRIVKCGNWK